MLLDMQELEIRGGIRKRVDDVALDRHLLPIRGAQAMQGAHRDDADLAPKLAVSRVVRDARRSSDE